MVTVSEICVGLGKTGRNISGILLFDKPVGLTSNRALQQVKALYQAKKAGHTGSLDPLAEGLLPICFGDATKISAYLLDASKYYQVTIRLGMTTTTGDAEGETTNEVVVTPFTTDKIQTVLAQFEGEQQQVPPMYSALKVNGQRLYQLARQGLEIERQARTINVYKLILENYQHPYLELLVHCSKGTYIRTLAEDIGQVLGCGAHIIYLKRIGVQPYIQQQLWSLNQLQELAKQGLANLDDILLSIDTAVTHLPAVYLSDDLVYYLTLGQPVVVPHAPTNGLLRLYQSTQKFLGVGQVLNDGRVAPKRLMNLS